MSELVLSLFPGIGLLDMAFEAEGFCVVRGPDLLWGGDVRRFHPPVGRFDGVIGGPPCQAFSRLRPLADRARGRPAENLIPDFSRIVDEAHPTWFVMENVPAAPLPVVGPDYYVTATLLRDTWVGGKTERLRRFTFGRLNGSSLVMRLSIDGVALCGYGEPAVIASCGGPSPSRRAGGAIRKNRSFGQFPGMLRSQGLPSDFLSGAPFTAAGKIKAVGNGVPLPMGRAIARAVRQALGLQLMEQAAETEIAG